MYKQANNFRVIIVLTVNFNKFITKILYFLSEIKIAGKTSEYVNKVLDKVKAGQNNGGLNDL